MEFECKCGYVTDDADDFLAHMIDCECEPEEHWDSYNIGLLGGAEQPFKNSEILEE